MIRGKPKEMLLAPIANKNIDEKENYVPFNIEVRNGIFTDAKKWKKRNGYAVAASLVEPAEVITITCGLQTTTSADDGSTWTKRSVGVLGIKHTGLAVSGSTQYVAYIIDSGTGTYTLYCSKHSGSGWSQVQIDQTTAYTQLNYCRIGISGTTVIISYLSGDNIVKIAKSTDSGATFTLSTVETPTGSANYGDLCVVDANTYLLCYEYNDGASVYRLRFAKTTDGGSNWTYSYVSANNAYQYWSVIKSLDATTIFIIFNNGSSQIKLAKSTDGGSTWSEVLIDTTNYSSGDKELDLCVFDANTLFVAYYKSTTTDLRFAKSTDAGATWSNTLVSTVLSGQEATGIVAQDANTIYIACCYDSGTFGTALFKSTDGGTNWVATAIDALGTGELETADLEINASGDIFLVYFVICSGGIIE